MDYTKIPELVIYKERISLEKFGVYNNHPINAPFAEKLLTLDVVKAYSAEQIALLCLNNAYYICTMFFLEKDPIWRFEDYKRLTKRRLKSNEDAFEIITLSLVLAHLNALNVPLSPLHVKMKDALSDYVSNHQLSNIYNVLSWLPENISLPAEEFAPREITENLLDEFDDIGCDWSSFTNNYKEDSTRELINGLGKTGAEKFLLLHAFEDEVRRYYGDNDAIKELLRQIADELSEKYGIVSDADFADDKGESAPDNDPDANSDTDSGEKWIDWLDTVFHPNINAEEVAKTIRKCMSSHLSMRCNLYVAFRVLSEINWIPSPSNHQKDFLMWGNAHFDCGWDWWKKDLFKFTEIDDRIKTTSISQWDKNTMTNRNGEYYRSVADALMDCFVTKVDGDKLIDKSIYVKPGCLRVNDGKR